MICVVTIIRYPKYLGWAGVISMALFHLPLMLNKKIKFYKLMGSGKDGSFSTQPDWRQWAVLTIRNEELGTRNLGIWSGFISFYMKLFKCKTRTFILKPISSKGSWDGNKCFDNLPLIENNFSGKIAVLTRATIKLNMAKDFWRNVPAINKQIKNATGLIESYGIGEMPLLKQATLSIWENIDAMKNFAYTMKEHREVITKKRKQDWYKEEMFTRFEVIDEIHTQH